jgi:serine/threonine protein phosphatase PrpC
MEDTHTIRDDLKFYGVYDGHGGEEAATILQQVSPS